MGEEFDGHDAQLFSVSCHFKKHPWISVSGVLLDSGHLWREDAGAVVAGLSYSALAFAEDLLEGLGYLGGFELGRQLLHRALALWWLGSGVKIKIKKMIMSKKNKDKFSLYYFVKCCKIISTFKLILTTYLFYWFSGRHICCSKCEINVTLSQIIVFFFFP